MSTMRYMLILILLFFILPGASSWSGEREAPQHADLAELVLRALEPRQAAPILAHLDAYRQGALDAETELAPQFHRYSPESGDGRALDYIANATLSIQENLTSRSTTAEDARRLGMIVHVLFDLTQPLHTGNGTIDAPYHAEYEAAAAKMAPTPTLQNLTYQRGNVTDLARDIARSSARRAAELEALLEDEGAWSPKIANLTNAALQDGAPRVAITLMNVLPTPPPPAEITSETTPTPTTPRGTGSTPTAFPTRPQLTVPISMGGPKDNTSPARDTPVSIFAPGRLYARAHRAVACSAEALTALPCTFRRRQTTIIRTREHFRSFPESGSP